MFKLNIFVLFSLSLPYIRCCTLNSSVSCSSACLAEPEIFGAVITSVFTSVVDDYQEAIHGFSNNWPALTTPVNLSYCLVNVTLTHPGANDTVLNQFWLPLTGWNERFVGIGGGGFAANEGWSSLAPAVQRGYVAGGTDAGVSMDSQSADAWALVSPGNVNQYALVDFASRSIHEMTVIGKQISASFYGMYPRYSYWQGCSTGGRQGLGEAQMYPGDYDGIVPGAPAINWNDFTPAQRWPYVVMENEAYAPAQCEFDYATTAAVAACDGLDGLIDGIIGAPGLCHFSAYTLVAQIFECDDNSTMQFSNVTATIVQKIWDGPITINGTSAAQIWLGPTTLKGDNLWDGINRGANFSALAPTTIYPNGSTVAAPFAISDSWIRNYLYANVSQSTASINYSDFQYLFQQGHIQYDSVIGTSDANLGPFRASGAKMLTWQGFADSNIMTNGTSNYYDRVSAIYPDVQDWYRVFFAPGVGHCGSGTGPVPDDILAALRNWVENGVTPNILPASSANPINGTVRHQPLCPYPLVSKYSGSGDPAAASSYECATNF